MSIPDPPIPISERLTAVMIVPDADRIPAYADIANAYCLERIDGHGGCIVWGYSEKRGEWFPNASGRWVVSHLLSLLGEVCSGVPCQLDRKWCLTHQEKMPCPQTEIQKLFTKLNTETKGT